MRRDVEQVLKKFQVNTFGNNKNIEKFENLLKDDEQVLYLSPTNIVVTNVNTRKKEKLPGICALTDKRFIFQYKILFNTNIESVSLEKINNMDCSGNSITGSHIQFHTITKTYDILVSYKKEVMQEIYETFESAISNFKNCDNSSDVLDKIKKLSELKESGIISDEEFSLKKQELLSRL